jgi:lysine-N-methylase
MVSVVKTVLAAARYMTRFRCRAGDCEATCCGGWGIAVEPAAHRRLKVLSAGNPQLSALVEDGIELTPQGPDYARLKFLPSGECSMLDEQGLCAIHAQLGHEALFDVCAAYPRYASEVDGERELFGTLSCPEVARLALLADDAFELTELESDEAPRKLRNRFTTERPYFRPYRLVRDAVLQLLARPMVPLSEKLFVLLWLSDRLRPVLHSGCTAVPEKDLRAAFSALSDAGVLEALGATFGTLSLDGPLPLMILHATLRPSGDAGGSQSRHFDAIVREVWDAYGLSTDGERDPIETELGGVWRRYAELRSALADPTRERIETCITRYAMNHVLTTPYMLSESLFVYSYDLVVRVACLRFLLHTRLASFTGSAAQLDASIVEVVFAFGRAVEHADLPGRLQALLARQGLAGLAHAACFLAV